MRRWIRGVCLVGGLVAGLGLSGCESGCDDETIDRAVRFLESHQECQTDDDCVIVSDFCGEIPSENAVCGALTMNQTGEQSAEWQELEETLGDCGPSECTVCGAARVPTCTNGSCGGL